MIVLAKLVIIFGIVLAKANTPISTGPINKFVINKSNPLNNICPALVILFQIPDETNSLIVSHLK